MITGRPPFDGETNAVLLAHVKREVPRLPIDLDPTGALDRIIRRAMAKVPEARFLDVTEMATELEAARDALDAESATLVADTPDSVVALLRAEAARREATAVAAHPAPGLRVDASLLAHGPLANSPLAHGPVAAPRDLPAAPRAPRLGLAAGAVFGATLVLASVATAATLWL